MGMRSSTIMFLSTLASDMRFTIRSMQKVIIDGDVDHFPYSETENKPARTKTDCFEAFIGLRNVCLASVLFWIILAELIHRAHFMFHHPR